jgi:hypothetical protein
MNKSAKVGAARCKAADKRAQINKINPKALKNNETNRRAITSGEVDPFGKYLMVGKPSTLKREPRSLWASASTLAMTVSVALAYLTKEPESYKIVV